MKSNLKKALSLAVCLSVTGAAIVMSGCSKTEKVLVGAALGATGVGLAAGLGAGSTAAGIGGAVGGGLLGGLIGSATHKDDAVAPAAQEQFVAPETSPIVPADFGAPAH